MKVEIILALVWMNLSIGERHQRSTVLTDESKRVLEHFDFSNFDKQEALNYLDRQRFENQIRGKRSQFKFGKDSSKKRNRESQDVNATGLPPVKESTQLTKPDKKAHLDAKHNKRRTENKFAGSVNDEKKLKRNSKGRNSRNKRGRRNKKKNRSKVVDYDYDEAKDNDYELQYQKRKRKKKKKRQYWDRWTEWSPCSVTCGRGRKIRWRKCIVKNCTSGEFEMGEKTCQLPACSLLTKILGF